MLFWLQEERKQHALDYEAKAASGILQPMSIIKPAHLAPIAPQV